NKYYIMTDKKQFKLFGKLQLPLYVERRYKIPYECIDYDYSDKDAEKILALRLDNFLKDKCEKGVQIIGKNVKMDSDGVTCRLKATITVFQDMIH
ncbi:MAG: sporulation protein YqfD, partial [Lachnospiraceae bacterium]|nr:sporulation protein YqfD [Lachnospiraceae bacterium]